jgi:3-phenylpropionate/cinnamic acid dioxygenase small subunit
MSGASEALRREIEDFLALEARLADESDYAGWEALVTDDMHYWVPKGRADYDPATSLSYINDNRARLATRIRQLASGLRRAQTPPSSLRRVLGLVEILRVDEAAGEYEVAANFVLYEHALQATGALRLWPGRATWTLRRVDGALRMRRKVVELVTASDAQPNLAFIL